MPDVITCANLRGMLDAATAKIRADHEHLSRLDGAVGDGDHGTTILRAMELASATATEHAGTDMKELLSAVGWAVLGCDGGSTGPLLGSFFIGMSDASNGAGEWTSAKLASVFDGGVARMQKQSRAHIGDKTMMDAFLPAVEALKSADPALPPKALLERAAAAAERGAEATKNMRAKFGRARNLGDRVIGHPDPGAVSISLILKGFSEGL
jgi:phosphoenolpyruvate---glycerone phosphotransferase subunit DhaL